MAMTDLRAPKPLPDLNTETIDATCQACGWTGDVDADVVDVAPAWASVEITYRWTCPGPCGHDHITRVIEDGDDS